MGRLRLVALARRALARLELAAAPSVLDKLAGCVVKPAKAQYGKFLDDVHTTLRDREAALRVLAEAVVRSVDASASKPRHLVVFAGPSGSGKTRGGYEGSAMWDHDDGQAALEEALKGKPNCTSALNGLRGPDRARGDNVLTLYIDLDNDLQYHPNIDKLSAHVRLGARLAARALGTDLEEVAHVPQKQLSVKNVLSAILRGQLKQRRRGTEPPLLLVVHVDEWQLYMRAVVEKQKIDVSEVVGDVKRMFSALNSFALEPPEDLTGKFLLLPILSGTPVLGGVRLDLTARMSRVDGPLSPLSAESSLELAVELFMSRGFADGSVREVLGLIPARVGLSDTGGLPRLLVRLCEHAVESAESNKARGDEAPLYHVKWAKSAQLAETDLPRADAVDRVLPLLALTGQPVEIEDPHGNPVETGIAKVVRDADQCGLVQLRPVAGGGRFVVSVPFVLLRLWCTGHDFPAELLRPVESSWTWDEFERLYAQFKAARLNALLEVAGVTDRVVRLCDVVTGARGVDSLLQLQVRIRGVRQVHFEEKKFMERTTDKPARVEHISAAHAPGAPARPMELRSGVFLAAPGNALFDMRYTLEVADAGAVHVFLQSKHTGTSDGGVNQSAIDTWYKAADDATEQWREGGHQTVLIYFTNRKLTGTLDKAFLERRPRLLVVTRNELSEALTPALVGRGLIPPNVRTA